MMASSGMRQLEQFGPHPIEHAGIVACIILPEQAHAWIPGAVIAMKQPAIVRRPRQQDPGRTSERAGEMGDAGIDRYHEIEAPTQLYLRNRRVLPSSR